MEHVGETLTVTSPGGFVGGISPSNIISHPAVPRYRCLAEVVAALGIAERQGIGVARMTRDMLALGRPRPHISNRWNQRLGLTSADPRWAESANKLKGERAQGRLI